MPPPRLHTAAVVATAVGPARGLSRYRRHGEVSSHRRLLEARPKWRRYVVSVVFLPKSSNTMALLVPFRGFTREQGFVSGRPNTLV